MRLTTKSEYALRALSYMLSNAKEAPLQIREISKNEGISKFYIEQLFMKMRRAGLIKSIRGPQGGYVLAKNPKTISIGDVVRSVEGPIHLIMCTGKNNTFDCSRALSCKPYPVWKKINRKIEDVLDSISLEELK